MKIVNGMKQWRVSLDKKPDNRKSTFMGVEYYTGVGFSSRPNQKDDWGRDMPMHPALRWDEETQKVIPLH